MVNVGNDTKYYILLVIVLFIQLLVNDVSLAEYDIEKSCTPEIQTQGVYGTFVNVDMCMTPNFS